MSATVYDVSEAATNRKMTTNKRMVSPDNRSNTFKLSFSLIILVTVSAVVQCQDVANKTTTTATTTIDSEPASSNGTLLSASEFVDFTESPTLLFDGTSNENPQTTTTTTTTTTESSSQNAQNTTTSPPTTTTSPEDASEETTTTATDIEEDSEPAKQPFEPPKNVSQYMDYIETLFHDFRHQISDLFEPHLPQLIRSSQMVQLSGGCSYDMLRMALALRQFEPWALRMIDSSGKVPEGIFEGSFTALGSYDECLNTVFGQEENKQISEQASATNHTQGKYCLVNVSPYLPPKPPADRVERMFQEEANRRNYTKLVGGLVFASVLALVLGATLMDYSRRKLDRQKRQLLLSLSADLPTPVQHTSAASDSCSQVRFIERLDKNWSWLSFSLFTNYRLYFDNSATSVTSPLRTELAAEREKKPAPVAQQDSNIIRCLNGIRVISLCWVIVANSYITLDPRATKRLTKTREAPKDFFFQMVAQASLAIETFFFLSGVLMSLSFARKFNQPETRDLNLKKSRNQVQVQVQGRGEEEEEEQQQENRRLIRLRWLQFYVHRYVRMTPATMLVIAFTMYAYGFGDGPLWFEATHKAHQSCSQNWWRHLLHVANFIDTRQMCFIHYWYIAADMQLFLFAPLLLYLIYSYRKVGYALITLIGASSIGFIFYTTYARNLPPTLLFYNSDPESRREFGNTIMTKPLTHALPYLVGMLVGKWLTSESSGLSVNSTNRTPTGREVNNGRSLSSLFGALATIVALAEVFLPYKWNNSHLPTRLLASLYAAFFRFAWSLVLAYIIMSCRHRRGRHCSPVNDQCAATSATKSGDEISRCASCQSLATTKSSSSTVTLIVHHNKQQQHNDAIIMSSAAAAAAAAPRQPTTTEARRQMTTMTRSTSADDEWLWCLCGTGGNLVNRLLSLEVFTYLSKLSFVAYLIHLPLMSVFIAQTRGLFAFSHTLVIHLALSYLVMTFLLSFVLVHLIELPFLTFERYLFDNLLHSTAAAARRRRRRSRQNRSNRKPPTGGYIVEPRATFIGGSYDVSSSSSTNCAEKL